MQILLIYTTITQRTIFHHSFIVVSVVVVVAACSNVDTYVDYDGDDEDIVFDDDNLL